MKSEADQAAFAALQGVPSIGPSLAADLMFLGIRSVEDLRGRDPQAMYAALCEGKGQHQDRCVLYSFRCAVYFASTAKPDPKKLNWWVWKDPPTVAPKARRQALRRGLRPAGA